MPPAHREKPPVTAVGALEALRPAGKVSTTRLGADAII